MSAGGPLLGSRLAGRYRIERLLGAGGMAEVYEGHDELLGRDVAVKILREQFRRDASFLERFRREARAAAALNHPNIVAVHDTGDDRVDGSGLPFIVMELVAGRSLDHVLSERRLPLEEALGVGLDICAALAYAHDRGIIHRDIKPANILVTDEGRVKVADFGIARAVGAETMTGSLVLGTAAYLSPEQARGDMVDARSDLYALGVVLFELVTGRPPFLGSSPVQVALCHVSEAPPRPADVDESVPPALDAVILRALAKDPADRHPSGEALAADLRAVAAERAGPVTPGVAVADPDLGDATAPAAPASATAVMAPSAPEAPIASPGWRRWRPHFAIGLLALAALLALWVVADANRPREVPALLGLPLLEAQSLLEQRGLRWEVTPDKRVSTVPVDHVAASDPDAFSQLERGGTVRLTLSAGPPPPPPPPPPVVQPPPAPVVDKGDKDDKDQDEGGDDKPKKGRGKD